MKINRLDLSARYPGYFDKRVFRVAIVLCLLLCVAVVLVEGPDILSGVLYLECPEHGPSCLNPFYLCLYAPFTPGLVCEGVNDLCADNPSVCSQEFLGPGESLGSKPGALFFLAPYLFFLFLVGSFVVNHALNWRKLKK